MNTTRLFIARRQRLHHAIPHRPSNVERVQAFRALAPPSMGNAQFVERFRAREYERQAGPSADYDNQLRDGFALKYGEAK